MKKETAIEYLVEKIGYQKYGQWLIGIREDVNIQDWVEQAKQIHKDEIAGAWNDGRMLGVNGNVITEYDNGNDYYNHTYDKEI